MNRSAPASVPAPTPEEEPRRIGAGPALAASLLLGAAAGVSAKVADESGIGWLSDLGTFGAIWVLAIVLIGRFAPTPVEAALRAALFFVALSIGYYAWATFVLGFPVGGLVQRWAVLSVTGVPVLAAAIWWAARQRGILPAIVIGLTAAIALFDGHILPFWYAITDGLPPEFPYRPIQAVVELATASVAVALLPRDWLTRLVAIGLALPAAWVLPELIGRVRGTLGV
jgi:hypothetical protein